MLHKFKKERTFGNKEEMATDEEPKKKKKGLFRTTIHKK